MTFKAVLQVLRGGGLKFIDAQTILGFLFQTKSNKIRLSPNLVSSARARSRAHGKLMNKFCTCTFTFSWKTYEQGLHVHVYVLMENL